MEPLKKLTYFAGLWVCLCLAVVGCGDDDDDENDGGAGVTSISLDGSAIQVGQGTVAAVKFTFSSDDVFDDDRNVAVAVRLPDALLYRPGTAEIKRPIDDRSVEPQVFNCGDGSSILVFDLDEDDLIDATNPGGNADAELRFTADAIRVTAASTVDAAADVDTIGVACGVSFPAQQSAVVSVG